ncbi:MAG: phage holin family protein [Rhodoferax sp.]
MKPTQGSGSAWGAVNHKATTLLEIAHTRLELLGNELEVARITIVRQFLLAQALLFCIAVGVVLTIISLIIVFWEQRLVVACLAAAAVWAAAVVVYYSMIGNKKHTAPLFNVSLAELQEDLRQLKAAAAEHERETR